MYSKENAGINTWKRSLEVLFVISYYKKIMTTLFNTQDITNITQILNSIKLQQSTSTPYFTRHTF